MGMLGRPDAQRRGETPAASSTSHAKHDMNQSTNRSPIMIEVPPARIPEERAATIPHAVIFKGRRAIGGPTLM